MAVLAGATAAFFRTCQIDTLIFQLWTALILQQ
jgi:hypothetical protein